MCAVCAALIMLSVSPWNAVAAPRILTGAATAGEAASPELLLTPLTQETSGPNSMFSSAQPDSMGPDGGYFEEEEEGKNLYRDIGVFLIISAFAGYFIIKVFLEGETEEPPVDNGGKDIPNPFAFKLTF